MNEELKNTITMFQQFETWLPGVKIIQQHEPYLTLYVSSNCNGVFGQSSSSICHLPEIDFKKSIFDSDAIGSYQLGSTTDSDGMISCYHIREINGRIDLIISKTFRLDGQSSNCPVLLLQIIPFQFLPELHKKVTRFIGEYNFKLRHKDKIFSLSDKKFQVLKYMTQFMACKEISSKMDLSENTINTHKQQLRDLLHINKDLELIFFGLAFDFIPHDPHFDQEKFE